MDSIMYYICYPLGYLMKWCWELFDNYGVAIIVFTLLCKIVMLPVSVWVHKESIKMVRIQPEVNFLKVKYYGNREKIAEEENKIQKRVKYNPFVSLIPLIVQIVLLMAVVYIVKQPLTHILHLSDDVCKSFANILQCNYEEDQLAIVRAVLNGTIKSSTQGLSNEAIDAIPSIQNLSLNFLGIQLDTITKNVWGWYIFVPIVAALSSLFLCYIQNLANVIQAEQGKLNKYGMTALSVGLSLFLGFIVTTGVALYWVASNLFAVIQQLILNWVINPKKQVDYEALEKSREELAKLANLDGTPKKDPEAKALKKREKADYKRFFKIVNKHLVIYSERSGFYKYFESLINGLLKKSNITIHYITNDPNDAIFKKAETEPRIKPYYIGVKKLIILMMRMDADIVVMTTPDLETYYIKRSLVKKDVEYIYLPHDMMSVHMGFRKGAMDHFDTVFCTGNHVFNEIRETEKVYGLPEKKLIPFGYPLAEKLEKSYLDTQDEQHTCKEILIAPSWQEDNLLDSCIDVLIEQLMDERTHLIVRPHPEYVKRYGEKIQMLTEKYKDVPNERLTFELDFTVNKSIYSSDLLVTDWSGIAYEFCFATKKPVLFVNTKMKTENPEWQKISLTPVEISLRNKVGIALEKEQLNDAKDAVWQLLNASESYKEQITEVQKAHLFSYGTDGAEGVKYILNRLREIQTNRKNEGK